MHKHGAALMCQITHLGRRGESYASDWLPTIGPSPIRETLHRSFPKAMDAHDIDRVVKAFDDLHKLLYTQKHQRLPNDVHNRLDLV